MLSEIIPQKLYVSDEHSACHYQWLDQLNIKSLLRLDKDAIYRKSWDEQGQRTLGTVHLIDGGIPGFRALRHEKPLAEGLIRKFRRIHPPNVLSYRLNAFRLPINPDGPAWGHLSQFHMDMIADD